LRVSFTRFELWLRAEDAITHNRHKDCVSGEKQHGIICEPRDLQIGGFPLPPFLGQEVSRACATGDVVHAREKSYAAYAESNRTVTGLPRSIRTLHHWRMPATRGNGRY